MKKLWHRLWLWVAFKPGQLVIAKTIPVVMTGTILEESKEVVGSYTRISSTHRDCCYVADFKGEYHIVYNDTIRKISTTKNPEYFI